MYILVKDKGYGSGLKIYGIVKDEPTAKRWVNWADGDFICCPEDLPIRSDEELKTASSIEREQKRLKEKTFPVALES